MQSLGRTTHIVGWDYDLRTICPPVNLPIGLVTRCTGDKSSAERSRGAPGRVGTVATPQDARSSLGNWTAVWRRSVLLNTEVELRRDCRDVRSSFLLISIGIQRRYWHELALSLYNLPLAVGSDVALVSRHNSYIQSRWTASNWQSEPKTMLTASIFQNNMPVSLASLPRRLALV